MQLATCDLQLAVSGMRKKELQGKHKTPFSKKMIFKFSPSLHNTFASSSLRLFFFLNPKCRINF